jgi:DNA-binding transcriptional LysR family regulator
MLPSFIVQPAISGGLLTPLLHDYQPSPVTLSVLYPRHRNVSVKVQLFVDFLIKRFTENPFVSAS